MELEKAEKLVKELMEKHDVGKAWRFVWINKKAYYGECNKKMKEIRLSRKFVEINNQERVRDVILHEIAHAKCRKRGHNKYFYAWCKRLGAKPERLNTSANRPK